jgi:hypothetical protein
MIRHEVQLDALQKWTLAAISDPECPPTDEIEAAILPSRQQSAAERLHVYRHAYLARLLEVLRELFPCTRFAVGDALFDQFAAAYLRQHPPHSYTLARLADHLAEHLDATRPADWGEFIVELIRLEQAIDRVFDAAGPERLPPFVLPTNADDSMKLTFVPGFELHAFHYPVSTFFTAWKAGEQPAWPQRSEQLVALFRRDYIVRRYELTAIQYDLLLSLSQGASLSESLAVAANSADQSSRDELSADIHCWFATWAASGFFASAS